MTQPIASFSGLASGIQWRDMVDQMIQVERRPVARLEAQLTLNKQRTTAWKAVQSSARVLADALKTLADGSAFQRLTNSMSGLPSGESPPFSVSTSAGATTGQFSVRVETVAQRSKLGSVAQASRTDELGLAGTLAVNGREVVIGETDTLNDVAARINAVNTGADASGVSASIMRTPDGQHRLVLTADRTGANGISLADVEGSLSADLGFDQPGAVVATGRNAVIHVDGQRFEGASNTFADIVDGVTFTAVRESATVVEVDISRDPAAARAAVKGLVDTYNALADVIRQQSSPGAPLAANGALRSMHGRIRAAIDTQLEDAAAGMNRLADIGVEIDRNGRYTFSAARFDEKLAADPAAVAALARDIAGTVRDTVDAVANGESGSIAATIADLENGAPRITERIQSLEARLDLRRQELIRSFTRMEQALSKAQTQSQWLASQLAQFEPRRQ